MNNLFGCKTRRRALAIPFRFCTFIFLLVIAAPACAFVLNSEEGTVSKWGVDSTPGTPAIISWGFMNEGTTVDPSFVMDPQDFPGQTGLVGTSSISTLQSQIDATYGFGSFITALQGAFDTWSEVTNILFVGPINDPGLPFGETGATAPDIRIGAFLPEAGHSFESAGAVSFGPPTSGADGIAGDILFNLSAAIDIVVGTEDVSPIPAGTYDLESLFLHALGHAAIGLGHPPWSGEEPDQRVMYAGDLEDSEAPSCCQTINRELHEDDIAGAWFTYGIRGDFTGDGTVDAADYTVWRDGNLPASDYDSWVAQFGAVRTQPEGNEGESIPEPSGLVLVTFGLVGFMKRASHFV